MEKVENCSTLEELSCLFHEKVTLVTQKLHLRDLSQSGGESIHDDLVRVNQVLLDLEASVQFMHVLLQKERDTLRTVTVLRDSIESMKASAKHCAENIPDRLPQKSYTTSISQEQARLGVISVPQNVLSDAPAKPVNTSIGAKTKKKLHIPSINYLTVAEFESVPKYIRGRMNYDKVNKGLDELNKAFATKYKTIATTRKSQTDYIRQKITAYKEQENKETDGLCFVVEDDIKTQSNLKLDKVGHALLAMYRHCGRLREIRGGGHTRFAILQANS